MVKLFCAVVGVAGSTFDVDISEDAYACDLTKMIKTKNLDILKNVDNDALQLFLAKKDNGAWLTATEAAVVRYESVAYHFKTINAAQVLMNPENFGEEFELEEGQVHVLVVAPVSDLTLEKTEIVVDGVNIPITDRMMFNSRTLVDFWRAFQEIPIDIKANAVVTLPEGTFLLGDPGQGSRIFIRPCYPQLWEVTLKMVQDEVKEKPHLVINGNSGIGKTYFGYVMLLYLARLGKTVVYESYATKKCVLFSHNVVVEGSQEDFIPILKLPTTHYIADGVDPAQCQAKTILLMSLDNNLRYTDDEERYRIRYMPVWSWDEISFCREVIYPDIPESVVKACFDRWGGIPRYVLQYAEAKEKQALLEKTIEIANTFWLLGGYGMKASASQVHRLLHYRVDEHFAKDDYDIASPYVQDKVYVAGNSFFSLE